MEDLRPHYRPTLWRWVNRLEAAREPAIEAASAERYRIWRIHMTGVASCSLSVCQTLAQKPLAAGNAPLDSRISIPPTALRRSNRRFTPDGLSPALPIGTKK